MEITDELLYQHAAEARNIRLSMFPNDADIPDHKFSRRFERKMKRLIREHRRSPKANEAIRVMRRVAAVILVVGAISFSSLMTVEAYREKVIEVIVQVFHDLTNYRFTSEKADSIVPNELPEVTFKYVPDGMVEIEQSVFGLSRYILYEAEDGHFFELTQTAIIPGGEYENILDTEDAVTEQFYIGDSDAIASTKNGQSTIIWSSDEILYTLRGTISLPELKNIASKIE